MSLRSRLDKSTVRCLFRLTVLTAAGKGPGRRTQQAGVLDSDEGRWEGLGEPGEWEKEGQEQGRELETGH